MIDADYDGSNHAEEIYTTRYLGYVFFLQCSYTLTYIPRGSPKKVFYCLNNSEIIIPFKGAHLNMHIKRLCCKEIQQSESRLIGYF